MSLIYDADEEEKNLIEEKQRNGAVAAENWLNKKIVFFIATADES